jgi:hypothetical protein
MLELGVIEAQGHPSDGFVDSPSARYGVSSPYWVILTIAGIAGLFVFFGTQKKTNSYS